MKGKIVKRSLALGALMAFVITGSAMAENTFIENTATINEDIDYGDLSDNWKVSINSSIKGFTKKDNVVDNTITINGASVSGDVQIVGGFIASGAGSITDNNVSVTSGTHYSIRGGRHNGDSGSIERNIVDIKDATVNSFIIGACAYNNFKGDIIGNVIKITNSEVQGVRASDHNGTSGKVIGNSVEITDSTANHVLGTFLQNGNFTEVSGNTVSLKGNTVVSGEVSAVRLTDVTKSKPTKPAKVEIVTGNNVTLSEKANVVGGIAGYKVGGEAGNKVTLASNNSLIITENWTGEGNGNSSVKANTLSKVENFDTIDVGWTESNKTLIITELVANSRSAEQGEVSEPVKFRLNDINTKVVIEKFVTQDKYGRVPEYDGRAFNGNATVIGTGRVRDQFGEVISDKGNISEDTKKRLDEFAKAVTVDKIQDGYDETASGFEEGLVDKLELEESKLYGTWEADVINGEVQVDTVQASENYTNIGIIDMANIALISWRAETNDMNKRMGELRNANGEHGVWVRMVRGEDEYGSIKHQYNQYQLGYDEKLSVDKRWTVGVALSYTDADNSFAKGNGESTNKALSVYGSKLNDDGTFIDLIAKYSRLENDFDVVGGAGNADYSTNGYSISAEFGKRIEHGKDLWIEPQVELTYGKVSNVDYVTESNVSVVQDGIDFLVGRVGFSIGKDIKKGNVYARASYLYDFDGETGLTMIDKETGGNRRFTDDLGGGWWEVGVGANINLSKATYIYADVEKTFGGEVDTNWQWNLGVRYSF